MSTLRRITELILDAGLVLALLSPAAEAVSLQLDQQKGDGLSFLRESASAGKRAG